MANFTRRTLLAFSTLALAGPITGVAQAQDTPKKLTGVVELFTSQGCSSCPPADAALQKYIDRDDVLALAFHVDYWDYLGWKDTLASPENTRRQYDYKKTFEARSVYTPQAVINGREHVVGSRGSSIDAKLKSHVNQGNGLSVPIELAENGSRIRVLVNDGDLPSGQDVKLVLVYYKDETIVDIQRGENTGKQITYRNTVTETQVLGMWDGEAMDVEIPTSEISAKQANGCAVLLQAVTSKGSPGAILGAAILPRQNS